MWKSAVVLLVLLLAFGSGFWAAPQSVGFDEARAINDRDYLDAALMLIENADETIDVAQFEIVYYEKYDDSPSNRLVHALLNAAARGVRVRIVVDEFRDKYGDTTAVVRRMRDGGIDARLDGSETTTHTKLMIVDGEYVLVGSTNWSFYGLEMNREANVLIHSRELAGMFVGYFEEMWKQV